MAVSLFFMCANEVVLVRTIPSSVSPWHPQVAVLIQNCMEHNDSQGSSADRPHCATVPWNTVVVVVQSHHRSVQRPETTSAPRRRQLQTVGERIVLEDVRVAREKDPALRGLRGMEVLLYPGIWAIWTYRLAHRLHRWGIPLLPRAISQLVRMLTGIEIHPGAVIGRRCFIDHGMGVVIGETAAVGDDVMLYHGTTLGSKGWWTDGDRMDKRHPTVGDRVVVGTGASVLGPVTVGHDSVIGAHALVLQDVPAHSFVRSAKVEISAQIGKPTDEQIMEYCI